MTYPMTDDETTRSYYGSHPHHDYVETGPERGTSRAHLLREMRCRRCGDVTWLPVATMDTPPDVVDEIHVQIDAAYRGCS